MCNTQCWCSKSCS